MQSIELRYGLNPHQKPARLFFENGTTPLEILNGTPGTINLLDAFAAWQLARELKFASGLPGAASFKHVSPAGAAIAGELNSAYCHSQFLNETAYSPVASAYIRARGGDRMCSFGDVAAVSDCVDESLALFLKGEVSDAIIAPDYTPEALAILKAKKGGNYLVLKIDPAYEPPEIEVRNQYGFTFEWARNNQTITTALFENRTSLKKQVSAAELNTALVATIALKYTQSNSVCVAWEGQVIGMGAGQQSRIHCTRLACNKADKWFLQQHPHILELPFIPDLKRVDRVNAVDQYLLWDELSQAEIMALQTLFTQPVVPLSPEERQSWINRFTGKVLSSDAFIPFRDNIDRASRSGIGVIVQTGGSLRDCDVTQACDEYGMVEVHTGLRLFLH